MGKLDIVVFGASGDTGRCCSHYLHNFAQVIGVKSWAPAARNLKKLEKLLGDVGAGRGEPGAKGVLASPAIQADSNDYESILAMCKQARVVVACAGPFADFGENVVKACVEAGTDYVDITGETFWVDEMAQKYNEEATAKGVSLLSQSAYDSVPSDITVALAARALMEAGEQVAAAETHHKLAGGALPVGTLKTVLNGMMQGRRSALQAISGGVLGKLPVEEQKALEDAKKKRKELKGKPGLVPKVAKSAISNDVSANMKNAYSSVAGAASLPSFMTVVNTPIVHTTAVALGYGVTEDDKKKPVGKRFTYRERLGENNATLKSLYGYGPVVLTTMTMAFGALIAAPIAVPLLFCFPKVLSDGLESLNNSDPGAAKAKAFGKLFDGFQKDGLTEVQSLVSSKSGKKLATTTFSSKYDAGLGFTALSALTVAAAIMNRRDNGEKGNGFETAVVGVGPDLLQEYYHKAGVKISTTVVDLRESKL